MNPTVMDHAEAIPRRLPVGHRDIGLLGGDGPGGAQPPLRLVRLGSRLGQPRMGGRLRDAVRPLQLRQDHKGKDPDEIRLDIQRDIYEEHAACMMERRDCGRLYPEHNITGPVSRMTIIPGGTFPLTTSFTTSMVLESIFSTPSKIFPL